MKRALVALAAVALTSCTAREVSACEEFIKEGLRSPSTYRRVKVSTYDVDVSERAKAQLAERDGRGGALARRMAAAGQEVPPEMRPIPRVVETIRDVFVEYDADNAYGTPVRGLQRCGFALQKGQMPSDGTLQELVSDADHNRAMRELRDEQNEPEYTCCL